MRTVVYPPTGPLGLGRSRTVGVIAQPLHPIDALRTIHALDNAGIPIRVDNRFPVVHIYALAPMSTLAEVHVLYAFAQLTDCRLAWHEATA